MIANYQMVFSPDVIWTIAVTVIWVSIAVSLRSYKGLAMKKRLLFVALTVVYTGAFAWLFLFSGFPEDRGYSVTGYRPDLKYEEYGAALAFTVSATETDMKKPAGYSSGRFPVLRSAYRTVAMYSTPSGTAIPGFSTVISGFRPRSSSPEIKWHSAIPTSIFCRSPVFSPE